MRKHYKAVTPASLWTLLHKRSLAAVNARSASPIEPDVFLMMEQRAEAITDTAIIFGMPKRKIRRMRLYVLKQLLEVSEKRSIDWREIDDG